LKAFNETFQYCNILKAREMSVPIMAYYSRKCTPCFWWHASDCGFRRSEEILSPFAKYIFSHCWV